MDAWIMFGAVLLAGYLLRYGQDRERREAEFRKGVAWGKIEERQARRRLSWCWHPFERRESPPHGLTADERGTTAQ